MESTTATDPVHAARVALIRDAFFRLNGIEPRPKLDLHPHDDMSWPETLKLPPVDAAFEYLRSGHEALTVMENALEAFGRPLGKQAAVLDFASGFGRMLRFLSKRLPTDRVFASDLMRETTRFTQATFGVHSFPSAADPREIAFPRRFSAIWVGSLFTHLPPPRFAEFLSVLAGQLEPDGVLLFSTHALDESVEGGHKFQVTGENPQLDEHEYGLAWTEATFVPRLCEELGLRYGGTNVRDLWRIQDVHAVLGPEVEPAGEWRPTPIARGGTYRVDREGARVRLEGCTNVPKRYLPIDRVLAHVGDTHFETGLSPTVIDSTPQEGGAMFPMQGFSIEGSRADLPPGDVPIVIETRFGGGHRSLLSGYVEPAWNGE